MGKQTTDTWVKSSIKVNPLHTLYIMMQTTFTAGQCRKNYDDIAGDVVEQFDTSDYKEDHPSGIRT